nr:heme uptake protein IsdC [Paenibacillus sp. ATY16]
MGAWILSLLVIIACIPAYAAAAASLEAGSYSADYVVLRAEDDSASIANDYWEKPATVTVAGNATTVRMTINHTKWVKEFSVPSGSGSYSAVKVVGTDEAADKRTVEFRADDLSKPISAKIHVTVEDIGYDHKYTIRFSFDTNSFKPIKAAGMPAEKPTETPKETPAETPKETPKETQAADKGISTGTAKPSGSKEPPASTVKPASTEEKGASGAAAAGSGNGKESPEAVGASAAQEPSATPAADAISPEASKSPDTPADSTAAEEPEAAEASGPGSDEAIAAGIADDADAETASAPLAEEALQPAGDNGRNLKGIYILAGVIIAGAVMFIVQRRKRSTRP